MRSQKGGTLREFILRVVIVLIIFAWVIPKFSQNSQRKIGEDFRTFFPGETLPAPGAPCSGAEKTSLADTLTEMELNAAHKDPVAQENLRKAKNAALEKCDVHMD